MFVKRGFENKLIHFYVQNLSVSQPKLHRSRVFKWINVVQQKDVQPKALWVYCIFRFPLHGTSEELCTFHLVDSLQVFFPPDRSQQTLHVKEQIAGFAEQEAKSEILIRFLYNNRKKPKFLQNCINEVQNVTVIIEYMYYNADLIRRRNWIFGGNKTLLNCGLKLVFFIIRNNCRCLSVNNVLIWDLCIFSLKMSAYTESYSQILISVYECGTFTDLESLERKYMNCTWFFFTLECYHIAE